MPSKPNKTVAEVFPGFADELVELIRRTEHPILADQVKSLVVVDRCRCGDEGCAHFYTAPPPKGAYGPGHGNIMLESTGDELLALDVIRERIVGVEVLDRPDVTTLLDDYLPLSRTGGETA